MYIGVGFIISGLGRSPEYPPVNAKLLNSSLVRVVSSFVSKKAAVMKSLIAPTIGPPYLGERIWSWTVIRVNASERDSSFCGTWRFISSPSKSAL